MPNRVPWSIGEGVGAAGIFFVSNVFFSKAAFLVAPPGAWWPGLVGAGGAAVLTLSLVFTVLLDRAPEDVKVLSLLCVRRPPLWPALKKAIPTLAAGFAGYYAVSWLQAIILQAMDIPPDSIPRQQAVKLLTDSPSGAATVTLVVFAVAFAPVVEETIFRGMLYLPVRSQLGPVGAAVLVSLVFAGVHNYAWGFPQLFVVGLILAAVFEATNTLLAPMLVHGLYNAASVALLMTWSGQG